jgi:aryl-alcohol dehydrogenase-like predicted oxidoreductase
MLPSVELQSGYRIPRLIRGTWQLHEAARTLDRNVALVELTATFDLGFSAIETADTYDGVEELLGAFRAHLRNARGAAAADALRVHTRVSQLGIEPLSVQAVRGSIDRSRRRLGQDRLDLVQLQWWNLSLPGWRDAAQELSRLRAAGAIAEIGVTNFPAGPLTVLLDAGVPVMSNQVQVSLLDPRAQAHVLPLCKARNLSLLGYGPLAGGFLTAGWYGKPDPGLEPHGDRPFGRIYRQLIERFGGWSWLQELLQVLAACGVRHHTDIASIALAWTLAHSGAAALLVGIGSAHRPAAYRQAAALVLDQEDIAAIAAVLDRRPAVTGDVGDVERTGLLDTIAASYTAPAG